MMIAQNKRLIGIVLSVAFLLFIPLVGMQFSPEVNWSWLDFVVMGILLLSTGLAIELILRKVSKRSHQVIIGGAILMAFLLIWAELAVGVFGTPFAGS